MDKRNEELLEEKGLMIEMDAEIAKVFKESTKVSCRCRLSFIFLIPFPNYSVAWRRRAYDESRN